MLHQKNGRHKKMAAIDLGAFSVHRWGGAGSALVMSCFLASPFPA